MTVRPVFHAYYLVKILTLPVHNIITSLKEKEPQLLAKKSQTKSLLLSLQIATIRLNLLYFFISIGKIDDIRARLFHIVGKPLSRR